MYCEKIIFFFQNNYILTLIASHGMTDLIFYDDPTLWLIYFSTLLSFSILPIFIVQLVFIWLSICHFYYDFDWLGGALMGFVVPYSLYKIANLNISLSFENAYLSLIHTPFHYYRMRNCIDVLIFIFLILSHIGIYVFIEWSRNSIIENRELGHLLENPIFIRIIGSIVSAHVIWNLYIHPSSYHSYPNYNSCISA